MKDDDKAYVDCVHPRREAARMLGCSVETLRRLEASGQLPRIQITPRVVGYRDSVLFMHERTK
jgi:hypothetical protein